MQKTNKLISLLIALVMAVTSVVALPLTSSAADSCISGVSLSVSEIPTNTPAANAKNYVTKTDSEAYTVSEVKVLTADDNKDEVTGNLQSKTQYLLAIYLDADDGIEFSGDGNYYYGNATVNGTPWLADMMSESQLYIEYVIQVGYVGVTSVNSIVKSPAVGSTVESNRYASVVYNPSGAGSNKAYIYWFESDTSEGFSSPMEPTDTFKKGKYYMASPDPEGLNAGYKYTSTTKFLINGAEIDMGAVVFGPLGEAAPKTTITGVKNKIYTGKALTQRPTVKIGTKTLKAGTDYKLSYKNNKNVGTATMTVTFIGSYSGTAKRAFRINPKSTTIKKVTAGKKSFTANWIKQTTQTTGYQLQYSTSSKFKKPKTVTIKGNKTSKKEVKKLTSKKKYYVRVRTYKIVSGKKYYSTWSKAAAVTVK